MPKTLRSGERELVLKVKRFCEREKTNKAPLIPFENVRRRVAAMTGISEKTVTKICQEGAVASSTNQITPDIWKKECDHVRRIEEKYYANDLELDKEMDNFIIEVKDSETSSDSDCDSIISGVNPIEMDHSYNK